MKSLLEKGVVIALLLAAGCLQLNAEEATPVAGWTEDFNTDSWVERWVPGEKGVRRDSHVFPPLDKGRFPCTPDAPARESGHDFWVMDRVFPCLRSRAWMEHFKRF
jgi:hypothetical protein